MIIIMFLNRFTSTNDLVPVLKKIDSDDNNYVPVNDDGINEIFYSQKKN